MLVNPIIQRELVTVLRTRKALFVQLGLVLLLTVLVMLRWPSDSLVNLSGKQAQQVLSVFGYGLMAGLILLAPAFPATSIVRERVSGTLALLLNTPMTPWSILQGKLLGVSGFVVLLVLVSLPAASACYVMGGVSLWGQLIPMYVVLVLLAVQYATLGLLVSSYATNIDSALRSTYGLVLVMAVLTLGPYQFLRGMAVGPAGEVLDWIRCISPIPAMMETLGHQDVGGGGLLETTQLAWRYSLLAVMSNGVFALWTMARLGGWILDRARSAGQITDERSAGVRAYRRIMYLWFFDPQRRSGMIGPMSNPVMIKEFRCRRFGRSNWMMRLIAFCMIASLGLAYFASLTWSKRLEQNEGVAVLGAIMVILQMALLVLMTPSLASGLISGERESGGWQLLQLTPLSPFTIVMGKLMSSAWTVLLIMFATLPGYGLMILIDPGQTIRVTNVIITLLLTAVFVVVLSALVSSLFKRTAVATATAYAVVVGLCAGTMLFWVGQDAPFNQSTVEFVLQFNPLAAALQLIEAPGFTRYQLVPGNWWFIGGMSLACLLGLFYRTWKLTRPS